MGHSPEQTEFAEMNAIEQMIRESSLPKKSMSYQIMNTIGASELKRTSSKPNLMKRTAVVAAAAAILGAGVVGTGFVSPAMASTLKQIPIVGILFEGTSNEALDTAIKQGIVTEPNLSVTHEGITLKVANLLYDGTRLSFVLEREGVDLPNTGSPYLFEKDVEEKDQLKGYIKMPTILANGQAIEYGGGSFGDSPRQKNAYVVEVTKGLNLPDQFELTIQANVTQVKEAFEFKIPVNVENKSIVVKPEASKSDGQFSYTVKQLDISPVSTRFVLDSKGQVPQSPGQTGDYSASMVYYELVDDQGNVVNPSRFEYFNSEPKTEYQIDQLFSPFAGTPKTITIKPFTLTVNNKDWSVVGQGKNSVGEKTYLKDLELTIPVKP
ncbi:MULTISPECIES: DUF4179 domain-containing protein [Paenibacillus]|uniref:Tat pathway signal protein n=1 Tax=Paenibacillus odorifer TaxID=189426 RepID=A0A1R0ZJ28_9BACL|nr:DUF4179 domain-containing protein [Paenibacillus odorifer]OMD49360.1 Tat pathway signal protein [Paenibacillus odorifer]OME71354.1 Tat pathway signal protein [Paenibacillus odorifer]